MHGGNCCTPTSRWLRLLLVPPHALFFSAVLVLVRSPWESSNGCQHHPGEIEGGEGGGVCKLFLGGAVARNGDLFGEVVLSFCVWLQQQL